MKRVSVIIPVRNNPIGTEKLLGALAKQNLSLLDQVVIVENGSRNVRLPVEYPVRLDYFHLPRPSRPAARNYGAARTTAPYLAFLDSDVIPPSDWLQCLMSYFDDDTLAVQSEIVPDAGSHSRINYLRLLRSFQRNNRSFISLNRAGDEQKLLNSSAFIVTTEAFKAIDGFDEALLRHEDLDFSRRLFSLSGKILGVKGVRCNVYFYEGSLTYLQRELSCGYHVVKLHRKWKQGSFLSAVTSFFLNLFNWFVNLFLPPFSRLKAEMQVVGGSYLLGNFLGLLCYVNCKSVRQQVFVKRADIVIL